MFYKLLEACGISTTIMLKKVYNNGKHSFHLVSERYAIIMLNKHASTVEVVTNRYGSVLLVTAYIEA